MCQLNKHFFDSEHKKRTCQDVLFYIFYYKNPYCLENFIEIRCP